MSLSHEFTCNNYNQITSPGNLYHSLYYNYSKSVIVFKPIPYTAVGLAALASLDSSFEETIQLGGNVLRCLLLLKNVERDTYGLPRSSTSNYSKFVCTRSLRI
jgi:hypothetical protein